MKTSYKGNKFPMALNRKAKPTNVEINTLAEEFANVLKEWLPKTKLKEINKRNATKEYEGSCASHDFCDPNQAMIDAFNKVYGEEPNIMKDFDNAVINQAWEIARSNEFYVATSKVSDENRMKVFDFVRCANNGQGVSQKEITAFMGWTNQSTIAAVAMLKSQKDITEIAMKSAGVTKDDVMTKGYIVEE